MNEKRKYDSSRLANLKILTESLLRKFKLPKTYRIGSKFKEANEHGKTLKKLSKNYFLKRH